jgi:pimeloyl-ACP methyl ester carboxylesterase
VSTHPTRPFPQPHVVRRGRGRPLLLIHGNAVDHRLLLPLDDALDRAGGWERIYLDLPGCGQTPPLEAPGGLPQVADWLLEVVPELVGGQPYALLGNSMGGLLARSVAAAAPEQILGLALLCPVVDPVHARRHVPEQTVLQRNPTLLAELDPQDRDDYAALAVVQSATTWRAFRDHALPGVRAANLRAMARLARAYDLPVPERPGSALERPAVVLTGRQDHVVGYEDQVGLLAHYPRATCAVLDRAGHNAHLDQPELVAAHLTEWLGRIAVADRPDFQCGTPLPGACG